jgi:hypothetical protein
MQSKGFRSGRSRLFCYLPEASRMVRKKEPDINNCFVACAADRRPAAGCSDDASCVTAGFCERTRDGTTEATTSHLTVNPNSNSNPSRGPAEKTAERDRSASSIDFACLSTVPLLRLCTMTKDPATHRVFIRCPFAWHCVIPVRV